MNRVRLSQVDCHVQQKSADLPNDCGDRRAGDSEPGKSEKSEDEDRIQDDIDHTSDTQQVHRDLHFADSLEDLFKSDLQQSAEGKAENDVCIVAGILQYGRIVGEQGQEGAGDEDARQDE